MKDLEKKRLKAFAFIMMGSLSLFLSACNTMEGAGTDIKNAGEALEHSAERNKESPPLCSSCPPSTRSHKVKNY